MTLTEFKKLVYERIEISSIRKFKLLSLHEARQESLCF